MKDTITAESFEKCLDALIEDIQNDHKKLQNMYVSGSVADERFNKGYIRSKMLIEEAKERWMKEIENGTFK